LNLPFPASDSTPVSDLTPYLPAQVLTSSAEVLVLTQHATEKRKNFWTMDMATFNTWVTILTVQARILKASQLPVLTRDLKLYSEERIDTISVLSNRPGWGTGAFPGMTISREKLDKLCLLTVDGWETTFRPATDAWDAGPRMPYAASRRDAIVAALRAGREDPFGGGEGPCEVSGNAAWPGEVRARVIEFLARPM
jgi:hypothetical protein